MNRIINQNRILNVHQLETYKLTRLFCKFSLNRLKSAQHIWFNTTCLKQHLCPAYVKFNIKCNSNYANRIMDSTTKCWLKFEKKRWYEQRDKNILLSKLVLDELNTRLHPLELQAFVNATTIKNNEIMQDIKLNQRRKIDRLILNKNFLRSVERPWDNPNITIREHHKFHKRTLNLSNVAFDNEEKALLDKGFKFSLGTPSGDLRNSSRQIRKLGINLERLANQTGVNTEEWNPTLLKQDITTTLRKASVQNNFDGNINSSIIRNNKIAKSIRSKLIENRAVAIKADKGNSIVILNQGEYEDKVSEFLSDDIFQQIQSDPTPAVQSQVKQALQGCPEILTTRNIRYLTVKNPQIPRLYGLPKIHKPNMPIRPVVSFNNAPTYRVSKYLNYIVKKHFTFENNRSVINNIELVNKIKDLPIPNNARLVSFDVTSLFTNVPVDETIDIVAGNLLNNNSLSRTASLEVLTLLETTLGNNYFTTNRGMFKQKEGLAMGSPLSPLLADIFMHWFENHLVLANRNPFFNNILYWGRYVDDILCLWDGDEPNLDSFLDYLNECHDKIKFTLEKDSNRSLNFLDLTISIVNDKFDFAIFRKPTHTDTTIPYDSMHPMSHKLAAYNSFLHRAISIPMSNINLTKELCIIRQIARRNGMDDQVIDKLIDRKLRQRLNRVVAEGLEPLQPVNWVSFDFIGKTSLHLEKIFKKSDTRCAFRAINTLYSILPNPKVKSNLLRRSGVYCLLCEDCDCIYIGKTARNFNIRFAEHDRAFRRNHKDASNFARHLLDNEHSPRSVDDFKILHLDHNDANLALWEIVEIRTAVCSGRNLCNEQLQFPLSPILDYLVKSAVNPPRPPHI